MNNLITVRVVKVGNIKVTREEYELLCKSCFIDGDRQIINEFIDLDVDGSLGLDIIEDVE